MFFTARSPAQIFAPEAWEGPYGWFATHDQEVVHAALIGKPGPHQGKVVLWRTHTAAGLWLWSPASPGSVADADPRFPPSTGPRDVPNSDNLFCACHNWDGDGDLIITGGDRATNRPNPQNLPCTPPEPNWTYVMYPERLLDAPQVTWQRVNDLLIPSTPALRWGHYYPSTILLPQRFAEDKQRVLQVGATSAPWNPLPPPVGCGMHLLGDASQNSNWWQIFTKSTMRWEGQTYGGTGDVPWPGLTGPETFTFYPLTHLLSTGHVFASVILNGFTSQSPHYSPSATLDINGVPYSSPTIPPPWTLRSQLRNASGQVVNLLYPTGFLWPITITATGPVGMDRVTVIGGWDSNAGYQTGTGGPASNVVSTIQSPQTGAPWAISVGYGALTHERIYANAVILPDLSVGVFGGSKNYFRPYDGAPNEVSPQPVYAPELLDLLNPNAGWQSDVPHQSPRLYHAVTVLLPDGRVLVAGGYRKNLSATLPHSDAEIYSPPYLRQLDVARPSIDSTFPTTSLTYGEMLEVKVSIPDFSGAAADEIEFATLIRCASVTHHFDWDQRCLKMEILSRSGDELVLHALPARSPTHPNPPSGEFIAPPGFYMLFVVRRPPAGGPQVRVPSVAKFIHVK